MEKDCYKSFNLIIDNSYDFDSIIQKLMEIKSSVYSVLQISNEVNQSKECNEYMTSAGYLPFSHKEVSHIFKNDEAICTIKHAEIYNGHIGDTEHSIDLNLVQGEKSVYIDIDLYCHTSLCYRLRNITSPKIDEIETIIHSVFKLESVK